MIVYSIIDLPTVDSPLWAEVVQEYATARRSLDGTLCVVKWGGETPAFLPPGAPLYYHPNDPPDDLTGYAGDILTALEGPDWTGFAE